MRYRKENIFSARNEKLITNTIASLGAQITVIICGFVVPRYIIEYFGSETNGLVVSIQQFLQVIAFLELGVGAVIRTNLYKPLTERNYEKISSIFLSAERFYRRIAKILLMYVFVLVLIYPFILQQQYEWMFTTSLIFSISISYFAQYYFGIVNRVLLVADQKGYVADCIQIIMLIINTISCVILIKMGSSIQVVKITTSVIYLVRPILLFLYVKKHYFITRQEQNNGEPIKQKWNGLAQHIASVILDNTDTVVLTIGSTLANVSVYSVYHFVVFNIKQLLLSMTSGVQSLIGELLAKEEYNTLSKTFEWMEWGIHTITTYIFGCTVVLIWPFVKVYTQGVYDVEYYQPLFALLIVLANAGHCLRLPYNIMILSAGHYKQTQGNYILASALNIFISVVTVKKWGLVGVTLGTLIAMVYQTIWMAYYDSKNFQCCSFKQFIKQIIIDILIFIVGNLITKGLEYSISSYLEWGILAVKVAIIWCSISLLINLLFYYKKMSHLFCKVVLRK